MELTDEILQRTRKDTLSQAHLTGMLDDSKRRKPSRRGGNYSPGGREIMSPAEFNQNVASNLSGYQDEIFAPEGSLYDGAFIGVPETLDDLGGKVIVDYSSKEAAYLQNNSGKEGYRVVTFGDLQGIDKALRRIAEQELEDTENDPVIGETVAYSSDGTGINPERSQFNHKIESDLDKID